jgi:hypothetical protein
VPSPAKQNSPWLRRQHHIANPNSHSIPIAVLSPVSIIHQFTAAQTAMSLKFSLHRTIDEKKREIEIGEEPVAAR